MMDSSDYMEVVIRMDPFSEENAEIAEAMVSDLPYDSFVIDDGVLKCYIQRSLFNRMELRAVLSLLHFKAEFTAMPVPSKNWNEAWETGLEPIYVGRMVTVKKAGDRNAARSRFNISLRPEMAFGTGHHDTTYMMIESMLEHEDELRGACVMDMGCGTGVLSILAAKIGAAKVYGIDIDAVAAQSAFDNVHLNRVGKKVETYCGDASLLQMGKYDALLANIHRNVIISDIKTYAMSLKSGKGLLFLSGFYEGDVPAIIEEAGKYGLQLAGEKQRGQWACLVLLKSCENAKFALV